MMYYYNQQWISKSENEHPSWMSYFYKFDSAYHFVILAHGKNVVRKYIEKYLLGKEKTN